MKIKRTHQIKNKHLATICDVILYIIFSVFEKIHFQHYRQKWNGKKRLKTIQITGIRSALCEDLGIRIRITFYWKVGKYYI